MKAFRVSGKFLMGDRWQEFSKEVVGADEEAVKMEVLSILGSKHRVKRPKIKIQGVESIPEDDLTDPIAIHTIQKWKESKD